MTDETEFDGYVTKYALTDGIKKYRLEVYEDSGMTTVGGREVTVSDVDGVVHVLGIVGGYRVERMP